MYHCQNLNNNSGHFIFLISFDAGSIYESWKNNGMSHFLEHLMFKTRKNKTKTLMSSLSQIGQFNAATTKDVTYYYISTTMEMYKQAIDGMLEVCASIDVTPSEFEKEKKIVIEEMSLRMDSFPSSQILMQDMLCNTPYEMPIIGTKNSIKRLSFSQVKDYFNQRYNSGLIVMNSDKRIQHKAKAYLESKLKTQPKRLYVQRMMDVGVSRFTNLVCSKPFRIKTNVQGTLSTFMIGFLGYPNSDPRFVFTEFICFALEQALFMEARERYGIAYNTRMFNTSYKYAGIIEINAFTSGKDAVLLLDIILNLLKDCKRSSWWENKIKYYKKSFEAKVKQNMLIPMVKVMYVMYSCMYDNTKSIEDMLRIIKTSTVNDVCKLCNELFTKNKMGVHIELHKDNYKSKRKIAKMISNANL